MAMRSPAFGTGGFSADGGHTPSCLQTTSQPGGNQEHPLPFSDMARFQIGIDLGLTNGVLVYLDLGR
jgi:hypothetical protein